MFIFISSYVVQYCSNTIFDEYQLSSAYNIKLQPLSKKIIKEKTMAIDKAAIIQDSTYLVMGHQDNFTSKKKLSIKETLSMLITILLVQLTHICTDHNYQTQKYFSNIHKHTQTYINIHKHA